MKVDPAALLARLRIPYERKGKALVARCPLNHGGPDNHPSWSILESPDEKRGAHFCQSCRQGGGPADLVSAVLGVELREALAWLKDGSLALASDVPERVVVVVRMGKAAFKLPEGVVLAPVEEWPSPARDYLLRRGVTPEQAARWGLGYAVDGKLASRIVVPARDAAGRLCSYTARAFAGRGQRYSEPTDEERPDRAAILGEHLWPVRARREAVLVGEGWFDVAAGERAAGLPVGALRGSPGPSDARWAPTVAKLATFREVLHLVDPGSAGARLHEDLRSALARYAPVRAVRFPGALDAADYARDLGDAALARLIRSSGSRDPEDRGRAA